jgi:hypothetical protein
LRSWRDRADFDETESQRSQAVNAGPILVESGREADRIAKLNSHYGPRIRCGRGEKAGQSEAGSAFQEGKDEMVRTLGIEGKQQRAGERIEQFVVHVGGFGGWQWNGALL